MEAPRGVERTGTNGRTHERPSPGSGNGPLLEPLPAAVTAGHGRSKNQSRQEPARVPVRSPNHGRPHPARTAGRHNRKSCGGHGPGETPSPIPNLEAKARHGDGTAPGRVWESSTPPHQHLHGGSRGSATRQPQDPPSIPTQNMSPPQEKTHKRQRSLAYQIPDRSEGPRQMCGPSAFRSWIIP